MHGAIKVSLKMALCFFISLSLKRMPLGKLKCYFMQPASAKYARIEFASEGLDINVIYKPMPLDYIKNIFPG